MRQAEEACCSTQPSVKFTCAPNPCKCQQEAGRQHTQPPASSPALPPSTSWSGKRQQHHHQWKAGLLVALLAAALLQPGCCAATRGDAQDRAFEDLSILARAGKPLTAPHAVTTPAAKEVPVEAAPVADIADVVSDLAEEGVSEEVVAGAPSDISTSPANESPAQTDAAEDGAQVIDIPAAKDRHAEKKVEKRALLVPDTQVWAVL